MPTRVKTTEDLNKQVARLARKFPALLDEVEAFISRLKDEAHPQLPGYKIRGTGFTYTRRDCQIDQRVEENAVDFVSIIGSVPKIILCL